MPTTSINPAAVRLSGLHKRFGPIEAVRGVNLTIAPGEVVAFLGPNGAGKSTTIDMLLGLTKPDAGTVSVFGRTPQVAVRQGLIGAMLQAGPLLPEVTVGELVGTFAALHAKPMTAAEAMRRADITDIARQPTTKLSGGQAQRVRFALALVPNPDLLVLDEPTVAMDVEVRRSFWASMREFTAEGRTVLFATHYLQEADDYADRVVVLAGGAVIADGTGASIKAQVNGRTIKATVPGVSAGDLKSLPGVETSGAEGAQLVLGCTDSDLALRALLSRFPQAKDIEVTSANLEEAFLQLTQTGDSARALEGIGL